MRHDEAEQPERTIEECQSFYDHVVKFHTPAEDASADWQASVGQQLANLKIEYDKLRELAARLAQELADYRAVFTRGFHASTERVLDEARKAGLL